MDHWEWMAATVVALIAGGVAGVLWTRRGAQAKAQQFKKRIEQLEQIRKSAADRITQMHDQISGLNHTVAELRQTLNRLETEQRRRALVDRAFEQSPFEKAPTPGDGAPRKDPASKFADTEVLE